MRARKSPNLVNDKSSEMALMRMRMMRTTRMMIQVIIEESSLIMQMLSLSLLKRQSRNCKSRKMKIRVPKKERLVVGFDLETEEERKVIRKVELIDQTFTRK